jgi:hypothetical protein
MLARSRAPALNKDVRSVAGKARSQSLAAVAVWLKNHEVVDNVVMVEKFFDIVG